MAKKTLSKTVEKKVRSYARRLEQDGLPISRVVVFGSYAKGATRRYSDIDVCVVSPCFDDAFSALQYLWTRKNQKEINIEPVGFSPKDYREGSSLINEIKRHGIQIKV